MATKSNGLLRNASKASTQRFNYVRTIAGKGIGTAQVQIDGACTSLREQARGIAKATKNYAKENPWKVLGIAAAVGVFVGLMGSRRHTGHCQFPAAPDKTEDH